VHGHCIGPAKPEALVAQTQVTAALRGLRRDAQEAAALAEELADAALRVADREPPSA
jgi:hypothetical protein